MAQVLLITGIVLVVLGVVLLLAGRSGERGYWLQRDTTEVAGQDDTTLGEVAKHLGEYAVRGRRPSLRIMAISMILVIIGAVCAVVGGLLSVLA